HRLPRDLELRPWAPAIRVGAGLEDRAATGDPSLVDNRSERVVDLLEDHVSEGLAGDGRQAALLELLGQTPQSPGRGRAHRARTLRRQGLLLRAPFGCSRSRTWPPSVFPSRRSTRTRQVRSSR